MPQKLRLKEYAVNYTSCQAQKRVTGKKSAGINLIYLVQRCTAQKKPGSYPRQAAELFRSADVRAGLFEQIAHRLTGRVARLKDKLVIFAEFAKP